MARNKTPAAGTEPETVTMTGPTSMAGTLLKTRDGKFSVVWDTLSPAVQVYIANYGFSKVLQDASSGTGKAAKATWGATAPDGSGKYHDDFIADCEALGRDPETEATTGNADEFAEALMMAERTARYDALLSGDIGRATAAPRPKVSRLTKLVHEMAKAVVVAKLERNKSIVLPADRKERNAAIERLVTAYVEKAGDVLRAKAEAQIAAEAELAGVDD